MLYFWNFRWLWLYFVFGKYVGGDWPSSTLSNVQLLGLFPDTLNASEEMPLFIHSRAMFKAAILLSHQYNITIGGEFIGWKSVATGGDVIAALRSSCMAISTSNIVGIVGPGYSREAQVIAPFAAKIGIPVISYAATDPELSDRNAYPTFYRTVPSDNAAALSIAKLFLHFNWTSCIIIYQNDAFGSGGVKAINEAFNQNNLMVSDLIIFDIVTLSIQGDLKSSLIGSSTRIVLVWAEPNYTTFILQKALDNDLVGPQFTWILSSNIQWNSFNQTWYDKLIGILTISPVVGNLVNAPINTTLLNSAYHLWQQYEPDTFPGSDNVNYYALFAFDATWTLIKSLEQFSSIMSNESSSYLSFVNTSFCFDRQFINSSSLINIINNIKYLGVSGSIEFNSNVTDRINGIYYIARNVQRLWNNLIYVPVLFWSDSNDWIPNTQTNLIVWPGNSLLPPTGYAAISGTIIRIVIKEIIPFTMVTQITDQYGRMTTTFTGYIPDLIELLQNKMGFIPNIILASSNQTYNQLVDDVANGVYDMFIADVTVTSTRREKVVFSSSIYDNSLRIIIREGSTTGVDLLSYLRPFSFKLWITLLIATIYAGFLISFLEGNENEALKHKPFSSLITKSMWYSTGTILGYGADFNVRTAAGRLLTTGLYILCLISVAAYTANLTILKSQNIISGINDIKNGKLPFNRIGIIINSSIEDYYLREISHGIRNFYPLTSEKDIYDSLLNNKIDACIMDAPILEYITSNIYCNLTLVGTDFDQSSFGIVVQKDWLYAKDLDVNILSLRESDALDNLKNKWFHANGCTTSSQIPTSMTIQSMAGLFLTFGIISILPFLLFLRKNRLRIKTYLRSIELLFKENIKRSNPISSTRSSIPNFSSSTIMYP
jgi:ionotropic glutamate receptor